MLNSYANSQNISIQAVTGTLQKTHDKSFFKTMHYKSSLKEYFFDYDPDNGYEYDYKKQNKKFIILQTMLMADGFIMVEIIKVEDFIIELEYTGQKTQ